MAYVMKKSLMRTYFLLAISLASSLVKATENYALLIGIGNYPYQPLEGPKYDVQAINEVLIRNLEFKKNNIKSLINQQATRGNILNSIEELYRISKPGDNIFFYYSGHGTSAYDSTIQTSLPNISGALIPYDIRGLKSKEELTEKLIKGRDDLKPRFSKLDKNGRHLFIAIDACYSGNAIRNINTTEQLPYRFINFSRLFGFTSNKDNESTKTNTEGLNEPYPYRNTYYLSAANEFQRAQDIPSRFLDKIPTIDNKPHGAFTNTLLEYFHNPINADLNRDQAISYEEFTHALSNRMKERGFSHTPSALPSPGDDIQNISSQAIFLFDEIKINWNKTRKNSSTTSKKLKSLGFK